jgi:hypothetical protein
MYVCISIYTSISQLSTVDVPINVTYVGEHTSLTITYICSLRHSCMRVSSITHIPHTTHHLLPTTYYLLYTTYYLLPTTYYLLYTTYYTLPPLHLFSKTLCSLVSSMTSSFTLHIYYYYTITTLLLHYYYTINTLLLHYYTYICSRRHSCLVSSVTHILAHTHIYVHTHKHKHTHTHAHKHTHTHKHKHKHTHTHTHIHIHIHLSLTWFL